MKILQTQIYAFDLNRPDVLEDLLKLTFKEVTDQKLRSVLLMTGVTMLGNSDKPTAYLTIDGKTAHYWWVNQTHFILVKETKGIFISEDSKPDDLYPSFYENLEKKYGSQDSNG